MARNSKSAKLRTMLADMPGATMKEIRVACNKNGLKGVKNSLIYAAKGKLKSQTSKITPKKEEPAILPSQVFNAGNIRDVLIMNKAIEQVGIDSAKSIVNEIAKIK